MTTERAQHPALKLPGFTRAVELSTGLTVHIRKVDVTAVSMGATRDLAASGEITPGQMGLADQASLALDVQRRLIRMSLVQPTLAQLLEVYGGQLDQDDLGLGADYTTLSNAIAEFNPAPQQPDTTRQALLETAGQNIENTLG